MEVPQVTPADERQVSGFLGEVLATARLPSGASPHQHRFLSLKPTMAEPGCELMQFSGAGS